MIELTKEVKQQIIDLVRADLAEKFAPRRPHRIRPHRHRPQN